MPDTSKITPEEFKKIVKSLDPQRPLGFVHRGASPEVSEARGRLAAAEEEVRAELAALEPQRLTDEEYATQIKLLHRQREEARKYREAEEVAQAFHETYERLAPSMGYETRKGSQVPWADVPADNKRLMIATARSLLSNRVICVG